MRILNVNVLAEIGARCAGTTSEQDEAEVAVAGRPSLHGKE